MALLALLFSLGSTSSTGAGTAVPVTKPVLTVESAAPLVVRGAGFRAGELVTVTAFTGARPQSVRVKAARGRFRANLRTVSSKCGGARFVRARGNEGSLAAVTLRTGICIPPPRN